MPSSSETRRGLTAQAFAILLDRLGPDAERAGAAYEHLRRGLVNLFRWRGAATPEECADETLDRLAGRLSEGVAIDDVARFAHGIARLVLLEHWRRPEARGTSLEGQERLERAAPEPAGDEAEHRCLDACLAELAPESRTLILDYYGADGGQRIAARKRLAGALRVSESALRNRAQRLRDRLEECITGCLQGVDAAPRPGARDTSA